MFLFYLVASIFAEDSSVFFADIFVYVFFFERKKTVLNSKLSDAEIVLVIYCVWYLFSVALNAPEASINRLMASINTVLLWFISFFLYFAYKNLNLDKIVISKIAFYNMLIMNILSLLYFLFPQINFSFLGRTFIGVDWLDGDKTTRFFCFFEYPNLIDAFCLIMFPLSLLFVVKSFSRFYAYIYCFFSLFPILASASRSGILLSVVMIANGILYIRANLPKKNLSNKLIVTMSLCLLILCLLLFNNVIISQLDSIFFSRSGSNNTRFSLYQYSVQKMLDKSPLFGCGIKETIPQFGEHIPLGSHSTYLGVLYKTGIVGFVIFLLAIFFIVKSIIENNHFDMYITVFISIFILFLTFEDVDGADWLLALVLSVAGCLSGQTFKEY